MTEQQKFEAWLGIRPCGAAHDFGLAAWQARASQDRSAELLEALEAMLDQFNFNTITGIVHDESAAIVKARAAISKARGE